MENIKHCYIAIGLLHISNQEKKAAKFAVQVCGSEKSFAVAEVQEITANVTQTCGFAVADHPLQFCGICGCGIEFKFAVPSTGLQLLEKKLNKTQLRKKNLNYHRISFVRCYKYYLND